MANPLVSATSLNFNLDYRGAAMGIALLIVMIHHTGIDNPTLNFYSARGFLGVDMFVFFSGAGCFYSLSNCCSGSSFLKKRLLRVGPPYWLFFFAYYPFVADHFKSSVDYLAYFFFVMRLNYSRPNWYFLGMWVYYLATLLLFPLVKCIRGFPMLAGYIVIFLGLGYSVSDELIEQLIFGRFPALISGLYFGRCSKEMQNISPKLYAPIFFMMALGLHLMNTVPLEGFGSYLSFPVRWMVASALSTPGLCILALNMAHVLSLGSMTRWILVVLTKIGECSLELLLFHSLAHVYQLLHPERFPWGYFTFGGLTVHQYYFNMCITFPCGFFLRLISTKVTAFITPYVENAVQMLTTEPQLELKSEIAVELGEALDKSVK